MNSDRVVVQETDIFGGELTEIHPGEDIPLNHEEQGFFAEWLLGFLDWNDPLDAVTDRGQLIQRLNAADNCGGVEAISAALLEG